MIRGMVLATGTLLLLTSAGCALVRYAFEPILTPPRTAPPPSAVLQQEEPDSMESVRIVVFPDLPPEFYEPQRPSPPAEARVDSASGEPTEEPAPQTGQPAIEPTAEPPWISIDIPEAERRQLMETMERDLEETRGILRSLEGRPMEPATREKATTIRGLIDQAVEARNRQDIRGASRLAHKARLLADELGARPAR